MYSNLLNIQKSINFKQMNNSLNIVTELVEQLKRFESEKGQEPKDLKEFTVWLNQVAFEQDTSSESGHGENDIDMKKVYSKMTAGMSFKEKTHVISFLRELNDYHSTPKDKRK